MTAIDGRHERHMMRQRGAGARSIPTNFGFIFQAGPIQVPDSTTVESSLPTHTPTTAVARASTHQILDQLLSTHAPPPKRKRVIREEDDDQVWFQKRSRKTTKPEPQDHTVLAATTKTALDDSLQYPPTEKKPTKRKVIRKRVLVPRTRKKDADEPQHHVQPEQPIPLPEPVAEADPTTKKKTRTKAAAAVKQKPKEPDTSDPYPPEDESSHHSVHAESIPKAAPPPKTTVNKILEDECAAEKGRQKAVPRKRAVRKHAQEDDKTAPLNVRDTTQTMTATLPPAEEYGIKKPKTKIARQRKMPKEQPEKPIEQGTHQRSKDEFPVAEQPGPIHEADPPPKKKKQVRRVRVPKTSVKPVMPRIEDPVETVNNHVTEPSASTDNIDLALFEAAPPATIIKKATKPPKRIFFNDDSEIDLDQMLSGIAAIAGTKGDNKADTSKSSRVSRKKVTV